MINYSSGDVSEMVKNRHFLFIFYPEVLQETVAPAGVESGWLT